MARSLACTLPLTVALVATLAVGACTHEPSPPQIPLRFLSFIVQPSRTAVDSVIVPAPQVAILDSLGQTDLTADVAVTIALFNAQTRTGLTGTTTVTAVSGIATFNGLRVDHQDTVSFVASIPNGPVSISSKFRVWPPYVTIAAGNGHSCATDAAGATYCWGQNGSGQAALGPSNIIWATPQEVLMPTAVTFDTVIAGGFHTCGLTPAGKVYCWGYNLFNQLGDGTNASQSVPTPVSFPPTITLVSLTAGYWHSCALSSSGPAYCWGLNVTGQLGDGTTATPTTPVIVTTPPGVTFTSISAGGGHSCALTSTGSAYCWGENPYGGLGNGTTDSSTTPVQVASPPGVTFKAVSAGDEHSCGLTPAGSIYCWGRNDTGQLGDGTADPRLAPVLVNAPGLVFVAVDADRLRTCAIEAAGALYCWGQNDLIGLLGDGTTIDRRTPVRVLTPAGAVFNHLSVGPEHTCAISSPEGIAYCWGEGEGLGNGSGLIQMTPVRVAQ